MVGKSLAHLGEQLTMSSTSMDTNASYLLDILLLAGFKSRGKLAFVAVIIAFRLRRGVAGDIQ